MTAVHLQLGSIVKEVLTIAVYFVFVANVIASTALPISNESSSSIVTRLSTFVPDNDSYTGSPIVRQKQVHRSIDEFPPDVFTEDQRRHGAVIVHLFVAFYGFVMITIVCHDYFLPSVFCICSNLDISPDVAGATFMAMATCTSELTVSVIGTFLAESDLGVGTVVGSGVYNTLGVPACAGLAASRPIPIGGWPLFRDSGVYVTSIAVLAAIAVDNVVVWYEALVMVAMYVGYFCFLFAQARLANRPADEPSPDDAACPFPSPRLTVFEYFNQLFLNIIFWRKKTSGESQNLIIHKSNESTYQYESISAEYQTTLVKEIATTLISEMDKTNVEVGKQSFSPLSKSICRKFASILWRTFCLPATFILSMTIPDCRARKKLYLLTFFMSIVWVSAVTYVLSWMLTICGDVFGINDIVMGIGVLAVGSSIPEAVSSIINAQNGEGSMSISSALGSNTMDILLCLGLPWFVKTCVLPTSMRGGPVTMETDSLFGSCVCMIAAVAVLDAVAAAGGFVIHRPFGCACLVGQAIIVGALLINGQNAAPIEGQ